MSAHLDACQSLDLAVGLAASAQVAALHVSQSACGMLYPFGTLGEALCPVTGCWQPVYMHLGFTDQRPTSS